MQDYTNNNPSFSSSIPIYDENDPVDAETVDNIPLKKLQDNALFLKDGQDNIVTSIAPVEVSPAEAAHAVGDYIEYGGVLYKVKAAIAVNDALVIDTNIELTTVAEAMKNVGSNGKCIPSVDSLTLDDEHPTKTFSLDYYGEVIIKVSDTSVATATVSSAGVVTVTANAEPGTCRICCFSTGDATHGTAVCFVTVTSTASGVYGVEWDGSALQTWTRTGAAANFEDPTPAVNNGTGSSPFDTIQPWAGMVRETRTAGGACVKIPKFWFKWTISGASRKLEISNRAKTGFMVSPAHQNRGDGVGERDYVYIGRYHCASDYKSTTGVVPLVSKTRDQFRTGIHALGTRVYQVDIMMMTTIWLLYLVEFANWDSQKTIGYGCAPDGSTSAVRAMGYTDAMQYHTGTTAVNRTTYGGTQYRNIEGLWDNCYDWYDGVYFSGQSIYCIINPNNFSDTTGGTLVGTRPAASNYIKSFKNSETEGFEWFMYPDDVTGASEDTYVGDYCDYGASGVVLFGGGYYVRYRNRGLFYLNGNNAASGQYANIGSRLQELPAAA